MSNLNVSRRGVQKQLVELNIEARNLFDGTNDDGKDATKPDPDVSCVHKDVAAFHPLKSTESFLDCWAELSTGIKIDYIKRSLDFDVFRRGDTWGMGAGSKRAGAASMRSRDSMGGLNRGRLVNSRTGRLRAF